MIGRQERYLNKADRQSVREDRLYCLQDKEADFTNVTWRQDRGTDMLGLTCRQDGRQNNTALLLIV